MRTRRFDLTLKGQIEPECEVKQDWGDGRIEPECETVLCNTGMVRMGRESCQYFYML